MRQVRKPQPPEIVYFGSTLALVLSLLLIFRTFNVRFLADNVAIHDLDWDATSPGGYLWSMTLWAVPLAFFTIIYLLGGGQLGRTWVISSSVSTVFGFVLEVMFSANLYDFPNERAGIGIFIPGFDAKTFSFSNPIPLEDFIFYVLGNWAITMIYLYGRDIFMSKYTPKRKPGAKLFNPSTYPYVKVALSYVFLVVIGFLAHWKYNGSMFPQFYVFLLIFAFPPILMLYPMVAKYTNWQSLAFLTYLHLLICVIWEVTLGVHYKWWSYKPECMIGLHVTPWFDLPVEAIIVWYCAPIYNAFFYEFFSVLLGEGTAVKEK